MFHVKLYCNFLFHLFHFIILAFNYFVKYIFFFIFIIKSIRDIFHELNIDYSIVNIVKIKKKLYNCYRSFKCVCDFEPFKNR